MTPQEIKSLLVLLNLKQVNIAAQVSQRLGREVSRTYVCHIIAGRNIYPTVIVREIQGAIARAFGKPVREVWGDRAV